MKRGIAKFASILLGATLVLSACGGAGGNAGGGAGGAGQGGGAAAGKVRLTLATWAGAEEASELQTILDQINAQSESFEIVHQPSPADYYTKLQTMIAGRSAPDLMWLGQEYIAPYAHRGAILDLSDRLAADDSPAADLDDYFEMVLESAQLEGRTYGLPWIAQPVIVYYNKQLLADAGVAEPTNDWTWEQFYDAASRVNDLGENIYGTTFNGWPPIHMFVWQAGGEVISPDLRTSPIDTPEAIAGLEFYNRVIYNPEVAPPMSVINEQGFGEMFKNGQIGFFFGGAADDLDRVEGLEVGHVKVPRGPQNQETFAWSASTVISRDSKNPDLAYEALVALTEGIHNWKIVAPRKSLATREHLVASEPRKEAAADTILAAAEDMRAFRIVPEHQEWDTIFWEQLQDPLFSKRGTASDLATATRPKLEAVLPK